MKLKKILATVVAAALLAGNMTIPSFAEQAGRVDGAYTAKLTMLQKGKTSPSMCDPLFVEKADVTISGNDAVIRSYVAFPVPGFPTDGADGTVKDVKLSYQGQSYEAELDLETKPLKPMKKTVSMFGTTEGEEISTEIVSFTVPKAALEETVLPVSAYVGVVMHSNVSFDMKLEDLTLVKAAEGSGGESGQTEDKNNRSLTVRATVAATPSAYTVTIPEAISMGELDLKQDNEKNYDVKVDIEAGNDDGYVKISAAEKGDLKAGSSSIAFTNSFGTREFRQSGTESATLSVLAKELKNKKPGDYTGTTVFHIEYLTK